ncbi:MAG: 3'(2'),5'-bisphosphate nucleotidase CysQ [Thermodesulfovibrionales bacterium]
MNGRSDALLAAALSAARAAAAEILKVYGSEFLVEKKEDDSPLTCADRNAHRVINAVLSSCAERLPVLSEEGQDIAYETRCLWRRFWLVDPLDGTKEFVKRNGEFTVNIALIEDFRPTLGVIAVPVRDLLYFGVKDLGAFRLGSASRLPSTILPNDILAAAEKLPLPGTSRHNEVVVAGSRSHGADRFNEFVARLEARHGAVRLMTAGSALKFCLVAEGSADLYPRFGPTMEWDTAAGQAIVEEAGGRVIRDDTGERLRYNKQDLRNPHFLVLGPGAAALRGRE